MRRRRATGPEVVGAIGQAGAQVGAAIQGYKDVRHAQRMQAIEQRIGELDIERRRQVIGQSAEMHELDTTMGAIKNAIAELDRQMTSIERANYPAMQRADLLKKTSDALRAMQAIQTEYEQARLLRSRARERSAAAEAQKALAEQRRAKTGTGKGSGEPDEAMYRLEQAALENLVRGFMSGAGQEILGDPDLTGPIAARDKGNIKDKVAQKVIEYLKWSGSHKKYRGREWQTINAEDVFSAIMDAMMLQALKPGEDAGPKEGRNWAEMFRNLFRAMGGQPEPYEPLRSGTTQIAPMKPGIEGELDRRYLYGR